MTNSQAMAQVFVTAFKSLPERAKNQVVREIIRDKRLREDLIDLAIAEQRARQPSRPFREFLSEIGAKRAP